MENTTKPNRSLGRGQKGKAVISNDPRHTPRRAFSTRRQSAADLELQDWVVEKLQLSSSKLPQKDLNRIATLASVYCRIKNLKGILATQYKEADIFKKSSKCRSPKKVNKPMTATKDKDQKNYVQEELTSNIHQDVSDQEAVETLQDGDVQDVGEARSKTAQSQSDLTPVETVDPIPSCSKDFDHQLVPSLPNTPADCPKSMTVDPMPGCSKDLDNEHILTSSRPPEDDPQPGTSTEFEPTPGCSKDPDVPLRSFSEASGKSNLSTLSSKSTKSEPIPASDYVDPFFRRSRTPDLRPDLEDESLPPHRRSLVPVVTSSHEEEEDPGKVNVDSDLMEMALFIHLAMMKRTRALQEMIDAQ